MFETFESGWISRRDGLRPGARLHFVRVPAQHQVLARAADIRRPPRPSGDEQLSLDAEVPLLGVRRLVLEPVPEHARVRGVQLCGRPRLDLLDRRERIVDARARCPV